MDIKALAKEAESYIIERRREYHEHPEISYEEKETRKRMRRDLEALGITEIKEMEHCYGLTAMIRGGHPGKTLALRTDTDALNVVEKTGLPFASKNNYMHACGHDTHMAMLLGAAKILNEHKEELHGNIKLIVQPAEEMAVGAKMMVDEHVMDGVDAIYGNHIWGNFDAPLFNVSPGNRMACCHRFVIEVNGASAHGSAPHLGIDALTAATTIIANLQQCVSRMNDPLNPLVLTIGKIDGGTRFNVIANKVVMEGTVRTFLADTAVEDAMRQVIEATAEGLGATASLTYYYLTQPVVNDDEDMNRIAHDAVVKLFGEEALGELPTMMGSEDFSWYTQEVPAVFAFIGTRNPEKGLIYTNHHEKFTADEDVLYRGSAVMAQFAVDYLEANA